MGSTRSIDLEWDDSGQCLSARNKLCEFVAGPDMTGPSATVLPGGHSEWEPPDPFSNSEVKTLCADASVGFVNVKVGHCQALKVKTPRRLTLVRGFLWCARPGGTHSEEKVLVSV